MPIYSLLNKLLAENKPAAIATVISGEMAGTKMLVFGGAMAAGGIHPDLDAVISADAWDLLVEGRSEVRTYTAAGVTLDVFLETFPPPLRLVIVGAVHVAIPLHRVAKMLGYHVTVVDARGVLATAERFPLADRLMVEWPDDAMNALGLDSSTSVVVLTHDPKFDIPALLTALNSPARYVGAIGSRSTHRQRMETLLGEGATGEQIARIHAPIGLDIGAQTPAEIAVAIMAEIVANQRGKNTRTIS
ncbi:MAG: xanthine dehydrogenase accessory factor [Chloroflexia bacterium]|jgi:xanthine dehydrogenase accessory factor|nr:xanthine dehydrogenase accessory factor [Chloroflexia bacterium]